MVAGASVTAGAVAGLLAAGVLAAGVLAAGGLALGAGVGVAVPGEVTDAGPPTMVRVTLVVEEKSPASFTKEAASTASASAATTATAMIGAFQFEDAARRVRAAAPQRRHQSWSGCSGEPQRGQMSTSAPGTVAPADRPVWGSGGAEAPLTRPP
jgi:hypothetical protein